MVLSEVTAQTVTAFIHAPDEPEGISMEAILAAGKGYIYSYTGLNETEADAYEDLTIALLVLCADMYDNRSMTVDKSSINATVSTILDMHSTNLV